MDVDRAHVSSIERGLQNATLLTVWETAQALGVRPAELFDEAPVLDLEPESSTDKT